MTAKSDELVDELVSAAIAFGRGQLPDWQTRIEKAQRELREYVAELEAEVTKCHELQDSYCDRIAELEGLVDELIEAGDWGAKLAINIGALSGDNQHKLAKKRYDKWDALVKDWKERRNERKSE